MIREAIKLLQKTAVDAKAVGKQVTIGNKTYLWDGLETATAVRIIDREPSDRNHHVESLASFLLACERWGNEQSSIWLSNDGIQLVIDDGSRFDRVTLQLVKSESWNMFVEGYTGPPSSARQYLRRDLSGCCDASHVVKFANVTFGRSAAATSELAAQKESLGRSVEQSVSSTEEIPDLIPLELPVYETHGCLDMVNVLMCCDIDHENQAFVFYPSAGEVARGYRKINSILIEKLGDNISVFEGNCGA